MKKIIITLVLLALSLPGFIQAEGGHNHAPVEPKHGGRILHVGDHAAFFEYVHDAKAGKVTVYILDGKGEKPLGVGDAIKINVSGKNKKQIITKAIKLKDGKSSTFEATDDALKNAHLEGKLVVKVDGKKYNVTIPHDHKH